MKARVLILTAGYGQGHNTAAANLQSALQKAGADATVEDLLGKAYPSVHSFLTKLYSAVIVYAPLLWELFYRLVNADQGIRKRAVQLGRLDTLLEKMIESDRPDIICSTHMLYNYAINRVYPPEEPRPFRQATVVTDSLTINRIWYETHSDLWYVPNRETGYRLKEDGVSEDRIHDLGFPVHESFFDEGVEAARPPLEKGPARILYIANSDRVAPREVAETLLLHRDFHLTMTVGKQEQLKEELEKRFSAEIEAGRFSVQGWSREIPRLMVRHHVVIGKAGGATTQEAIAARAPMLITHVVPGQEEGNYLLLKKHGAGFLTPSTADVIATLDWLFDQDAPAYPAALRAVEGLRRPDPAGKISAHLLKNMS